MKKIATIFILSLIVMIVDIFGGFPWSAVKSFNIASFLFIAILTFFLRRDFQILHHTVVSGKDVVTEMYVESTMKKTAPVPPVEDDSVLTK